MAAASVRRTAGPSAAPTPLPSPLPSVSPTLTSAPTDHEYQDNLVAYYPMTYGKLDDAHASKFHGKAWRPEQPNVPDSMMVAADLRQTEARDGPEGDAVALNNSKYIRLPDNVTRPISGDRPRTVCLWARIDKWTNKARIFEYGRKAPQGELFGLRTNSWNVPGEFAVEVPWDVRNHWDNRNVLSTKDAVTSRDFMGSCLIDLKACIDEPNQPACRKWCLLDLDESKKTQNVSGGVEIDHYSHSHFAVSRDDGIEGCNTYTATPSSRRCVDGVEVMIRAATI